MKIRIKNIETGEIHGYTAQQIKGGAKRILEVVKTFNELKKREDAKDWALMLKLVGMDYDIDWLEVTKYEIMIRA